MSLYKQYVPLHTCSRCGEHIDEGEPMWTDYITCLCAVTEKDDNEFVFQATTTGRFFSDNNNNSDYDLFLVGKKRKLYLVHFIDYRDLGIKDLERYRVKRYVTKEDADRVIKHCNKDPHYKFIRMEEIEVAEELLQ